MSLVEQLFNKTVEVRKVKVVPHLTFEASAPKMTFAVSFLDCLSTQTLRKDDSMLPKDKT